MHKSGVVHRMFTEYATKPLPLQSTRLYQDWWWHKGFVLNAALGLRNGTRPPRSRSGRALSIREKTYETNLIFSFTKKLITKIKLLIYAPSTYFDLTRDGEMYFRYQPLSRRLRTTLRTSPVDTAWTDPERTPEALPQVGSATIYTEYSKLPW